MSHHRTRERMSRLLTEAQTARVKTLLQETDMTLKEIAARMKCHPSTVIAINRRFKVRDYAGRRSYWSVAGRETSS